jgi:phospholipid/cholesterol/gamma-HCH transport system permease protein
MTARLDNIPPELNTDPKRPDVLIASGDWTFQHANTMLELLAKAPGKPKQLDALSLNKLDATGSRMLIHLQRQLEVDETALAIAPELDALLQAVRKVSGKSEAPIDATPWHIRFLAAVGAWVDNAWKNILIFLAFLGQTLVSLIESFFNPRHWRITSIVYHMQVVGLNAVPLSMLLSFMVGAVVAFLGATVLKEFGAQLWVVELVGVAFFREFGVLLTAILLAGRTASAFTAQIGSMKSGEELDAIKTMGLDPIEVLVLPRIKALLLTLPLLTFLSTMAGLLGGMAVCNWHLDISPEMFINRLNNELSPRHFWLGMSKAPIFAIVIGLIGCLEGFKSESNAQSVGEHTTSSVVQCITLVILLDALAALFFMELDL